MAILSGGDLYIHPWTGRIAVLHCKARKLNAPGCHLQPILTDLMPQSDCHFGISLPFDLCDALSEQLQGTESLGHHLQLAKDNIAKHEINYTDANLTEKQR